MGRYFFSVCLFGELFWPTFLLSQIVKGNIITSFLLVFVDAATTSFLEINLVFFFGLINTKDWFIILYKVMHLLGELLWEIVC